METLRGEDGEVSEGGCLTSPGARPDLGPAVHVENLRIPTILSDGTLRTRCEIVPQLIW